jgi:hypothetical protein
VTPPEDFELDFVEGAEPLSEGAKPHDPDPLSEVVIRPDGALFPGSPGPGKSRLQAPRDEAESLFPGAAEERAEESSEPVAPAAPLSNRLKAAAADALLCGATAAVSLLAAAAAAARAPMPRAWAWAAAFAALVSFFVVTLSLVVFGRTPGMALADLTSRDEEGRSPDLSCAVRRWAASALTAALAGIPLVTALWDRRRRTPADLLSGRPLRGDSGEPLP